LDAIVVLADMPWDPQTDIPDIQGALFEAKGEGWAITADVLRMAGFSFGEPKTEDDIKKQLF
jgi:hypothetical protein